MKTKTNNATTSIIKRETRAKWTLTISVATTALISILFFALANEIDTGISQQVLTKTIEIHFVGLS